MDKLIIEFNKKFDKQKQELIDGFKALGEEKRLPKALATIEGEQPTYKDYFKAGHQSRQAEVDELSQENTRLKYLVGEKIGHPSARDLLDAEVQRQLEEQKQSENKEFLTDEDIENLIKGVLKDHDENPNKYWINIYKQVDDLQIAINEKDKRIETVLNLLEYPTAEWSETVFLAIKALRGEHE